MLSLNLVLDGGGWSTPHLGCFYPGKSPEYQSYRRLGRPQGRPGRMLKISPPQGFEPQIIHSTPRFNYPDDIISYDPYKL